MVLCKDVQENRHVAIKFIPRKSVRCYLRWWLGRSSQGIPTQVTQYVERELMTHRLLWHPHVIKLYKVFLTSTHLAVVLEYAGVPHGVVVHTGICTTPGAHPDCGDMYDYVSKRGRLSESSARWIFQQLMVAVDYLHQMVGCIARVLCDTSPHVVRNRTRPTETSSWKTRCCLATWTSPLSSCATWALPRCCLMRHVLASFDHFHSLILLTL